MIDQQPYLDLHQEGGQHEGQGAAVDDETKPPNHQPGEDASDDPVLPPRRETTESLVQGVRRLVLSNCLADVLIDTGSVISVTSLGNPLPLRLRLRGLVLFNDPSPELRV